MSIKKLTKEIKNKSIELGFNACGISKATYLEEPAKKFRKWLESSLNAKINYLENNFDKIVDPGKLVEGAKSVISVILNYYPERKQSKNTYQIAKYAYGEDYHVIIKRKLKELLNFIKEKNPDINGRAFVDSAPVMEKEWARRAGLGWIGKNSLLINKELGSFVFIGELIVNIELEYDTPIDEYCGSCTLCLEACPTGAICDSKVIDCNKCISYHTIENRDDDILELKGKFQNYIYGCDICQDVCPWNQKCKPSSEPAFKTHRDFLSLNKTGFELMKKDEFDVIFMKSAAKRAGFEGLKRNIRFVKNRQGFFKI